MVFDFDYRNQLPYELAMDLFASLYGAVGVLEEEYEAEAAEMTETSVPLHCIHPPADFPSRS